MEERLARTPRKPVGGGGGEGSRQARHGRTSSGGSISSSPLIQRSNTGLAVAAALHMSHPGGAPSASPSTSTGGVPRIAGLAGAAAAAAAATATALPDGRAGTKPQRPPTSGQDGGAGVGFSEEVLEQGTTTRAAVAAAGEGRAGASQRHSPPGGSHTAR